MFKNLDYDLAQKRVKLVREVVYLLLGLHKLYEAIPPLLSVAFNYFLIRRFFKYEALAISIQA